MEQSPELEIEQLTARIEELRAKKTREEQIVEEKAPEQSDKTLVEEALSQIRTEIEADYTKQKDQNPPASYLDSLPEATHDRVQEHINQVFAGSGLAKVLAASVYETPDVQDAFHDALTDRLYETLKSQNILK